MNIEKQFTRIAMILVFNFALATIFTFLIQACLTGHDPSFLKRLITIITHSTFNVITVTGIAWLAVVLALIMLAYNNILISIIVDVFFLAGSVEYLSLSSANGSLFLPKAYLTLNIQRLTHQSSLHVITGISCLTIAIGIIIGLLLLVGTHFVLKSRASQPVLVRMSLPIFNYEDSVTRATFSLALTLIVLYPYLADIFKYIYLITK